MAPSYGKSSLFRCISGGRLVDWSKARHQRARVGPMALSDNISRISTQIDQLLRQLHSFSLDNLSKGLFILSQQCYVRQHLFPEKELVNSPDDLIVHKLESKGN